MTIFSIVAFSIISCLLIIVVREYRADIALLISVGAGCMLLIVAVSRFSVLFSEIKSLVSSLSLNNEYIIIMIKALGISYITQFASDTCNDFGQTALSSKVQLIGKLLLSAISIPLMINFIKMIEKLMG